MMGCRKNFKVVSGAQTQSLGWHKQTEKDGIGKQAKTKKKKVLLHGAIGVWCRTFVALSDVACCQYLKNSFFSTFLRLFSLFFKLGSTFVSGVRRRLVSMVSMMTTAEFWHSKMKSHWFSQLLHKSWIKYSTPYSTMLKFVCDHIDRSRVTLTHW